MCSGGNNLNDYELKKPLRAVTQYNQIIDQEYVNFINFFQVENSIFKCDSECNSLVVLFLNAM